jgi:uncharacterized protein
MPIISSQYRPPSWFKGRHLQTIMPVLFRKVLGVKLRRERINTPDGDFLDLDWSIDGTLDSNNCEKIAILSHGLEGSSRQPYMLGMAKTLNEAGWDTLSWNFRGCSGELNNKVRFYHAGYSDDLALVIEHVRKTTHYKQIVLVGFSLGGSMTLKYLGENGGKLPSEISHAIVFSIPGDLHTCCQEISSSRFQMEVYHQRFLWSMKEKLAQKIIQYPDYLSHLDLDQIRSITDFDNAFTCPLWGFNDANDYYTKCSCNQFIPEIRLPTLIVNAQNDPILHVDSHPIKECRNHQCVYLELPPEGGHVGFVYDNLHINHWSEQRAIEFLKTG